MKGNFESDQSTVNQRQIRKKLDTNYLAYYCFYVTKMLGIMYKTEERFFHIVGKGVEINIH